MENFTMLQFFEWYYPAGGRLWNQLNNDAEKSEEKRGSIRYGFRRLIKQQAGATLPDTMYMMFMILRV